MIASSKLDQLALALSKAQAEFGTVAKSAENPFFKSKYAALPDVVRAATPILVKYGLSVMQFPGSHWDPGSHVDTLTTIVMHESGQHIGDTMLLKLPKNDAQGQGSAMTYARRYSYMAALGLVADEDDDGNAASRPSSAAPKPQERPALTPMQDAATKDLKDVYGRASAHWSSLSDSEKNELAERVGFPLPLQAEFNRRAREAQTGDIMDGSIERMSAFTAELERLVPDA